MNPEGVNELILDPDMESDVYMPVTDDPTSPDKVSDVIQKKLNPNKSSGSDGVPEEKFKFLPINWILYLATLFNVVFYSAHPKN